jgi:heat shock protein HslJ/membrane-bound inhibitor of C-type lysozyme
MSLLRLSAPCALILALAACGERSPETPPTALAPAPESATAASGDEPIEVVHFRCGDTAVEARYFETRVVLVVEGEEIALSEVVAASGARYASGSDPAEIEFWSKGREAMLSMRGIRYPTCVAEGDQPRGVRYRALGQEPGWSLTWWGEGLALVLAAENQRIEATSVSRTEAEGGFILDAETPRGELRLIVETGRLCRDSMSGMPHPDSVRLSLGEMVLDGCGGEPAALLHGGEWRVTTLDGEPVLPEPEATLTFLTDGQVAGRGTCNRYSARYELSGEGLSIGPIAATKMACMGDGIMEQESLFLDILGKAVRFDIGEDGHLRIEAADGRSVRAEMR